MSEQDVTIRVDGIGGIDDAQVNLSPGTTILSGHNATNRTSLLYALNAALGGTMARPHVNADEGSVELNLDGEQYTRRLVTDQSGHVTFDGDPMTDDADPVDLYATLTRENAIRTAIGSAASMEEVTSELREMLMAPVDDDEIRERVRQLKQERRRVRDDLENIAEAKKRLPECEQRREELQGELKDVEDSLKSKREAVESASVGKEQSEEAQALLDRLEEAEREEDRIRRNLQTAEESLATAREEREELEERVASLEDELERTQDIDTTTLDTLRDRRDRLESIVDLLTHVQRANREVVEKSEALPEELRVDEQDVLGQLVESDGTIECWTCGSVVSESTLDERRGEIERLISTYREDAEEVAKEIKEIREKQSEREELREDLQTARAKLSDMEETVSRYEARVEESQEDLSKQVETVSDLQEEVEATEDLRDHEILDLHEEVRDLSRKEGRLERELDSVETEIEDLQRRIDEEDALRTREQTLTETIEELNGRIDQLEREAVNRLQGHLDELVDELDYENIARIRVDRVRNDADPNEFRLTVVREGSNGAMEDQQGLQTLSESERSLVGLVVGLAGYQTHDVADSVPIVLLDSVEEFDSERIGRLVDYISDDVPCVVAALLPDDTDAVSASSTVSAGQLGVD